MEEQENECAMLDKLQERMGERLLDYLFESISKLEPSWITIDPAKFDDPLAMQTKWTPVKKGGASFRTHKLVEVSPDQLQFRATIGRLLRYFALIVLGVTILVAFLAPDVATGRVSFRMHMIIPLFIYAIPLYIGGHLLYVGTIPIVFDRQNGYFWRGRKAPDRDSSQKVLEDCSRLSDIHALQIISKHVNGITRSYFSYELNLILRDAARINVINHGKRSKLRKDAVALSRFLRKPLWDATDNNKLSLPDYAAEELDKIRQQNGKKFTIDIQTAYKDYRKRNRN